MDTASGSIPIKGDDCAGTLKQTNQVASFNAVFAPPRRRRYLEWVHLHFWMEGRNQGHEAEFIRQSILDLYTVLGFWKVGSHTKGDITLEPSFGIKRLRCRKKHVAPHHTHLGPPSQHQRLDKALRAGARDRAPCRKRGLFQRTAEVGLAQGNRRSRTSDQNQGDHDRQFPSKHARLPIVQCVRRFIVSCNSLISPSPTRLLLPLLSALPRLNSIRYEPRCGKMEIRQEIPSENKYNNFLLRLFTERAKSG